VRATKVNAGLAESNGRLLLGIWRDSLHVTCGLTACTPGSARAQRSVTSMGKLYLLLPDCHVYVCFVEIAKPKIKLPVLECFPYVEYGKVFKRISLIAALNRWRCGDIAILHSWPLPYGFF